MDSVAVELRGIKQILQQMLDIMQKPESRVKVALEKLVLIAGALGMLNAVDVIRKWLIGG